MKYHATAAQSSNTQLATPRDAGRLAYWRATRRLTAWLSVSWLLVTFPVIFFARQLAGIVLFGWPLSFYMAAQGTLLAYVAIVGIYAWRMRQLDRQFNPEPLDGQ